MRRARVSSRCDPSAGWAGDRAGGPSVMMMMMMMMMVVVVVGAASCARTRSVA